MTVDDQTKNPRGVSEGGVALHEEDEVEYIGTLPKTDERPYDNCAGNYGVSEGGVTILPSGKQAEIKEGLVKVLHDVRPYDNCAGTNGVSEGGVTLLPDSDRVSVLSYFARRKVSAKARPYETESNGQGVSEGGQAILPVDEIVAENVTTKKPQYLFMTAQPGF